MISTELLGKASVKSDSRPGSWVETIIKGDCVSALGSLPSHSFATIFAAPPDNLQLGGTLH
ncbi:hypothetical protein AB9F35_37295, partial [Rhizobium leguminosarum]